MRHNNIDHRAASPIADGGDRLGKLDGGHADGAGSRDGDGALERAAFERCEADHRIANSLQRVAAIIRHHRRQSQRGSSDAALQIAEMQIESIAHVHRHLGALRGEETVDLAKLLSELCGKLEKALRFRCDLACDPIQLPGAVAAQIAIIVSEITMNAVKHAYDEMDNGLVSIQCRDGVSSLDARDDVSTLRIRIADEGHGLIEGFGADGPSSGIGMSIVTRIVEDLNAVMTTHTNGGAVFTIEVPLPQTGRPNSRSYSASATP